ncbi:MAG TPA: hypothetical protein VFR90_01550 [Methylibium sp.]|uniref:hypothetical protein n=1 Tax=Methylibium sp. TaxID=2067992 RepID=UPI002DBCF6B1|nr:hypothetical protein [Methylibium sp.]HEU4457791.1 hypothetical protein [Methylibium sp.]
MKRMLSAIVLGLAATLVAAQSGDDLARQAARGVADLSRARVKQLGSGEWLRERLEVDAIAHGVEAPGAAAVPSGVVKARVAVFRSAMVTESMARSASLPTRMPGRRYEVELRFVPDAAHGLWVFEGGRYWILDDAGQRRLELTMFSDLLRDAPLDAPHELAWAIMSP